MILAFTLSMPGCGSWNGRWTGEKRFHALTRTFQSKKAIEKAESVVGYYTYNWSDGWCAGITVREVDKLTAAQLRKKSSGFCGYEWMIDSIMQYGEIRTPTRD